MVASDLIRSAISLNFDGDATIFQGIFDFSTISSVRVNLEELQNSTDLSMRTQKSPLVKMIDGESREIREHRDSIRFSSILF